MAGVQFTLATMDNMEVTEKEEEQPLSSRIQELRSSNEALLAENDMFESFIGRLNPHDLESQAGGEGTEGSGASQLEGGGRRRRSRSSISDRPLQLTLEQKLYIAQSEIKATQQDREDLKRRSEVVQDNYKASMEVSEMCLAEIRKAKKEFERIMLKRMKDTSLEIKDPEKVLQCLRDKSKDNQLEKLHLKIQALKAEEKKLQQKLQLNKEMGKAEFKKEIIQEKIEQRSDQNPDELKVKSLTVQRVLSSHKEKLHGATMALTELSHEISNREQMLVKLDEDIHEAEEKRSNAEALNQHLLCQMTDYQAPDVTEYMQVKAKHRTLEQSIHIWERKVKIAEMALKTYTKARGKQRAALTGAGSGEDHVPQ
ncbi:coiled-coil domain-containing protein 113 [Hippoglossus stenolepis]|uniref:coiled-coil domain-containing protein 113 n=1 Tax=Hippoglossus stenolepis TaxID=195615 RepID=UPI001FB027D0|nr:coiled-coil domain-containing protein 113 [Hippoglossus stenolepis]